MRYAPLAFVGLALFTWLGFELFPGHSYLRGATQLYVPIIERLASPGYLSRDLVATHPNVTYTVYDEVALFTTQALGLSLHAALQVQQALFRLAWVAGLYLIARACAVDRFWSVMIAAIASLGMSLTGAGVIVLDPEPTPRGFAFGLTFLAIGWLAGEKPLLAGLAGGLALIYDARVAAPFWIVLLIALASDKQIRYLLRPCIPILIVFVLLLANLAQLQPGAAQSQDMFVKISPSVAMIQMTRTPWAWVSRWAPKEIWHYLAILVVGFWAMTRIWFKLNRQMCWIFVCLPLFGVLSVPLSYLLLERLRWAMIPQLEPAKTLAFSAAICLISCAIAGAEAIHRRRGWEATFWLAFVFLVQTNVQILNTLRLAHGLYAWQLGLALVLGGGIAWTGVMLASPQRWVALLAPFVAMFAVPLAVNYDGRGNPQHRQWQRPVNELAAWAGEDTWAGSVFAFPDAFLSLQPGVFRANSERAIWVDWESGAQCVYSESFAEEWWGRWQQMMRPKFSAERLQGMLALPVDYYVLKRENALAAVREGHVTLVPAVFRNGEYVVYEANQLRNASGALQVAGWHPGG